MKTDVLTEELKEKFLADSEDSRKGGYSHSRKCFQLSCIRKLEECEERGYVGWKPYAKSKFDTVIDKAKSANIALVGIGSNKQSSTMLKLEYFSSQDFNKLIEKGAIGDICSNFYDIQGNIINNVRLNNRILGMGIRELKNLPIVIGVACGEDKKEAILGALRGGFINTIVTNQGVAEYLINNIK
jgi:DNA-binding transcriptional regulator LsrR (DeoR family)